jgi:hypothetical protein
MMPRTLKVTILLALDQLRWAPPDIVIPVCSKSGYQPGRWAKQVFK